MIVKGIQRKATGEWAAHLLRADHNEEVRIAVTDGLAADTIPAKIEEMAAYALGTRCKLPLFEVVLNPDEHAPGTADDFAAGRAMIEEKYPGLKGQPFFAVEHFKGGKAHQHLVWARCATGKAVNLPHTKIRTMEVSGQLYERMGIEPPEGVKAFLAARTKEQQQARRAAHGRDIDHATFKAAERQGIDARDLSALAVEAWKGGRFIRDMRAAGYAVAQGDRRGFVLVNHAGDVIPLRGLVMKPLDLKAKDVRAVLGMEENAQSIEDARKSLQPPTLTQKFEQSASKDNRPAEVITLTKKLEFVQRQLDEKKEQHRDLERRQRDTEQAALKAHADMLKELKGEFGPNASGSVTVLVTDGQPLKTPEQLRRLIAASITVESHKPAAEGIEAARTTLRNHHRAERQTLAETARKLARDLKRENLLEQAARIARLMREKTAILFERFAALKDQILKPTAPSQAKAPDLGQEQIGPLKSTEEFSVFTRDAERKRGRLFGGDAIDHDTGRERPGPGSGRKPPGRGGPGF